MDSKLIVKVVVGTPDQMAAGTGETVIHAQAAAIRIGISTTRFSQLVHAGVFTPCAKLAQLHLFREEEIERYRSAHPAA